MIHDSSGNLISEPVDICNCGLTGGCEKCNRLIIKTTQQRVEERWEKEFDREFNHYNPDRKGGNEHGDIPTWSGSDYYLIKSFIRTALQQARDDERERMRIILMRVLYEVEKEHGSKNVYLDMVGELFTEEIDKLKPQLPPNPYNQTN